MKTESQLIAEWADAAMVAFDDGDTLHGTVERGDIVQLIRAVRADMTTPNQSPEHSDILKLIAHRARCFPMYPIGYHIPEVFAAIGEDPPDPEQPISPPAQPAQCAPAGWKPFGWVYDFLDGVRIVKGWISCNQEEAFNANSFNQRRLFVELAATPAPAPAVPQGEHAATVAEVHMSRYTLEWHGAPLPEGTKLYAAPAPAQEPRTCNNCKNNVAPFGACDGCEQQSDAPEHEGNWAPAQEPAEVTLTDEVPDPTLSALMGMPVSRKVWSEFKAWQADKEAALRAKEAGNG